MLASSTSKEHGMNHPSFIILYVDNAPASAAFYSNLLDLQPLESSPGFALFQLQSGLKFGLWSKREVRPAAYASAGSSELVFAVDDPSAVRDLFGDWSERGLAIAQPPTQMEFGYTFVALDPDGHRIRVFAPGAA